jgi:hypothetical protein
MEFNLLLQKRRRMFNIITSLAIVIAILTFTYSTEVLPHAIAVLQKAGYNLVTLAECLGQQPYQQVVAPQAPDVSSLTISPPTSLSYLLLSSQRGHVNPTHGLFLLDFLLTLSLFVPPRSLQTLGYH